MVMVYWCICIDAICGRFYVDSQVERLGTGGSEQQRRFWCWYARCCLSVLLVIMDGFVVSVVMMNQDLQYLQMLQSFD